MKYRVLIESERGVAVDTEVDGFVLIWKLMKDEPQNLNDFTTRRVIRGISDFEAMGFLDWSCRTLMDALVEDSEPGEPLNDGEND